ncbi:unnamed protein product [Fraxinus pennsylvanica]|uniref:Uncharacterized protein n=1 Tax=Fraxinus pennsylvanica TaxID=56036 RepID=A0AAD1ZT23_9LAMI|nr:unnamed protein product [Fraxinus pennsylvanica]
MSFDPEDKAPSSPKSERPLLNPLPAPQSVAAFMMDVDLELDLESSWSSDQIFTNLMSPFQLSNSEQPCSPLWAFNDENNDCKPAGNSVPGGGFRLSNCSRHATNPESITDNGVENDDKRKLPSPLLGLRPIDNPDESCIIKERMTQALRYFKDLTGEHVLAQVWAPVKNGGRYVLTTSGQPFVLDSDSNGLHQYRLVSLMYMFSVDGETDGALGLPGRVFWQRYEESWSSFESAIAKLRANGFALMASARVMRDAAANNLASDTAMNASEFSLGPYWEL